MISDCNGIFSCLTATLVNTIYASIICSVGFALGFTVVAALIHEKEPDNIKNDSDSDSQQDKDEESESVKYCKKYWEDYDNLTIKDLSEEDISSIEKCLVIDNLPFYGGIHMRYNKEFDGYHYYNDRGANIPYKMLATVARKFVTTFNCKSLYINLTDELEKSKQILEEIERRIKNPTEEEIKESVFANTKKSREKGLSKEKKDEYLIKGNFIRFKYMGKVSDLEVFKKKAQDEKIETENKPKVIDFATFKNMFSLSKTDKDKDV